MIRRTHIHWVDLDPAQGSEAAKRRPAVVVSNDRANATAENLGRGVITVGSVDYQYRARVSVSGDCRVRRVRFGASVESASGASAFGVGSASGS